jgi:hypothetical protein
VTQLREMRPRLRGYLEPIASNRFVKRAHFKNYFGIAENRICFVFSASIRFVIIIIVFTGQL